MSGRMKNGEGVQMNRMSDIDSIRISYTYSYNNDLMNDGANETNFHCMMYIVQCLSFGHPFISMSTATPCLKKVSFALDIAPAKKCSRTS